MQTDTFCILPWIHFYANPDGSVIPCCIADHHLHLGNLRKNKIQDIWNNDNFKNLRKQMMEGKRCEECKACYQAEDSGNSSSRQYYNEKFSKYFYLKNHTTNDGYLQKLKLVYFDIRWSNICNFKCRSCSGTYSSSWAIEDVKHGRNRPIYINAGGENNDDLYSQLTPHFKDMEEIYFAGGEPLLTDKHFQMLDYLIENNLTNIELRYNTNLSVLCYKSKSILDYWKHFKNVNVYVSLDSWGDRAEYIREGTKWDEIMNNLKLIKFNLPHVNLQTHTVISCFNVFTFVDFLDYLLDSQIFSVSNFFPTTYNLLNPNFYSFDIIKDDMKKDVIEKLQSRKYNHHIDLQIETIIHGLEKSLYNDHLKNTFVDMTNYYDKIRDRNFCYTFPELNFLYDL